jgi:membrane-associated phospholipid phosphatase
MRGFLISNRSFLIMYLVSIIILLPFLVYFSKSEVHMYMNNIHAPWADFFFKYITNLGSGLVVVLVAILYLFLSFRKSLIISASGIACGLIVQILKQLIFNQMVRPIKFFQGVGHLHLIDGVQMLSYNSFPSGHSATIFALCLCLAAFSRTTKWKIILFCIAVLVAFSRIYLSQHFLADTYFGSMIGILTAFFAYVQLNTLKVIWLDKSLRDLFNKSNKK